VVAVPNVDFIEIAKRGSDRSLGSRPVVRDLRRSLRVGFQPNPIIHRIAETLFAAQVPLRRLHRDMPKKELNLL
jgi:hypothetical protein